MRFPAPGSFRTYSSRNVTCSFALPSLSAGTLSASVHALSRSRQFPHVQFPHNVTCGFTLPSLSAGTVPAVIHALSRSRQFPHVQFPQCYMRFRSSFSFRRYYSRSGTCDLALPSLSAGTFSTAIHALSPSPLFPHIQPLQPYI